jgi:hypothetical protein
MLTARPFFGRPEMLGSALDAASTAIFLWTSAIKFDRDILPSVVRIGKIKRAQSRPSVSGACKRISA